MPDASNWAESNMGQVTEVLFSHVDQRRVAAPLALAGRRMPVVLILDLAVDRVMDLFLPQPIANEHQDHVLEMMKHPHSVVTFSDSGAHVSQRQGCVLTEVGNPASHQCPGHVNQGAILLKEGRGLRSMESKGAIHGFHLTTLEDRV